MVRGRGPARADEQRVRAIAARVLLTGVTLGSLLGLLTGLLAGCDDDAAATAGIASEPASSVAGSAAGAAASGTASAGRAASSAEVAPEEPLPKATAADREGWQRCKQTIAKVRAEKALPGAPDFDKNRVQLARVRGRSMLWRRAPRPSPALEKLTRRNRSAVNVVRGVRHLIRDTHTAGERRHKLLREGYLWASDVRQALALQQQVSLTDLFREDTIYLQRGVSILKLERKPADKEDKVRYVYADGHDKGVRAEVLLGDRMSAVREELSEQQSLALDLRHLMDNATFDRIRSLHLTDLQWVAELRFGPGVKVEAVLDQDMAVLKLNCVAHSEESFVATKRFERETRWLRQALPRMRAVVRAMVREEMPFDSDPNQSNGFLRKAWKRAYNKGWKNFQFEDKSWPVYTKEGNAQPPQVCIDFITDTWERSSGTWYHRREADSGPRRTEGAIDFDKLAVKNRRSVANFTEFTQQHPDLFDVWEIPKDERIAFKSHKRFFQYLSDHSDHFRPGDILTIHGYKRGGRPHYHSVIILEQDPITGQPSLVAGNAVVPREQTLAGVMHISPSRTLRHRIRVRDSWLAAIAQLPPEE